MFRTRRLRTSPAIRRLVRETTLATDDLVYPIFVEEGRNIKQEIVSMPGIYRYSIDRLHEELDEIIRLNIPAVLLFGIPQHKDATGSSSWDDEGIIAQAVRAIKAYAPQLYVITDVCFCEYTDHGHCGVLAECGDHLDVDNDATLQNLARQALCHAKAGADMIAPSGMMDGMIQTLRQALDNAGFVNLPIMAYAVKYASAFYGPFRDAADSTPQWGDRKTYQMDPANRMEALREAAIDEAEGADILMVKPALSYLDILRDVKNQTHLPVAAYNVSGEYAMIKAAAQQGWLDGEKAMWESLLSMKRAGADILITYFAKEVATLLQEQKF